MALKRAKQYESERSVQAFIKDMKQYPILDPSEEQRLAHLCVKGDKDAMDKLVNHNLLFVDKVANQYTSRANPADDLITVGSLGLMEAAKRFKPGEGKFITYAVYWVRAMITRHVATKGTTVRFPAVASMTIPRLRKFELGGGDLESSTAQEIREALGETTDQYVNDNSLDMARRAMRPHKSLNSPVHDDESTEVQDNLVSDLDQPDDFIGPYSAGAALEIALECLEPRAKYFIKRYHMDPDYVTLDDLGDEYGISREAVRLTMVRAFVKMKRWHNNLMADALGEERYKVYWNKKKEK